MPSLLLGLTALEQELKMSLADFTLFLPNRRSLRTFREVFIAERKGAPGLLPRMYALGDLDEEEFSFPPLAFSQEQELPPAVSSLQRLFLIQNELAKTADAAEKRYYQGEQGHALAAELARLFDQLTDENIDIAALKTLAPDDYAEHWKKILRYLTLVMKTYPEKLKALGYIDAAVRRKSVIDRLTRAWLITPPQAPMIVAGSTGSIPAVRTLMKTVTQLPQGIILFPGLDESSDDAYWHTIGETHPQYIMKTTLAAIEVARSEIRPWPFSQAATQPERVSFIKTALAPASMTSNWHELTINNDAEKVGLALLECEHPAEEAGTIALILREVLEDKQKNAALVTPDRNLARRVAAELKRFGINANDSAGTPLSKVPGGVCLRLLATMVMDDFAPVSLLAFLKHPYTTSGKSRAELIKIARQLDRWIRQKIRHSYGIDSLLQDLKHHENREERQAISDVLLCLQDNTTKLKQALLSKNISFAEILKAHLQAATGLIEQDKNTGLFSQEDGQALRVFLEELQLHSPSLGFITGEDYPALLTSLLMHKAFRPSFSLHPRIHILGPLEARLQNFDTLVLGNFNEGSWPPTASPDPWMSQAMRRALKLPSHELRIGQSAHDFLMITSGPRVVLTRSLKVEGTPTVPSRWLTRIKTLLGDRSLTKNSQNWLMWQRALDATNTETRTEPPTPRPPVTVRPRKLSVTEIGVWMRDPYSIYARHILRLKPLMPIDSPQGSAERGTLLHSVFKQFLDNHKDKVSPQDWSKLELIGKETFGEALKRPSVTAFWWPRFEFMAKAFLDVQAEYSKTWKPVLLEESGSWILKTSQGSFEITAKADRIDQARNSSALLIIDYKSGTMPNTSELLNGCAPQLPLEGVIVEAGGFNTLQNVQVQNLEFWNLGNPKDSTVRTISDRDSRTSIENAKQGMAALVEHFDNQHTPYLSNPDPKFKDSFREYDHLARYKEWRFQKKKNSC